jgi:hypothetical protein
MTLQQAKTTARVLGFVLRFVSTRNEYRLSPDHGTREEREAEAYYTTDLDDALATARWESMRRGK